MIMELNELQIRFTIDPGSQGVRKASTKQLQSARKIDLERISAQSLDESFILSKQIIHALFCTFQLSWCNFTNISDSLAGPVSDFEMETVSGGACPSQPTHCVTWQSDFCGCVIKSGWRGVEIKQIRFD